MTYRIMLLVELTKPSDDRIRNNQKSSTAYHHIDGNKREYHK